MRSILNKSEYSSGWIPIARCDENLISENSKIKIEKNTSDINSFKEIYDKKFNSLNEDYIKKYKEQEDIINNLNNSIKELNLKIKAINDENILLHKEIEAKKSFFTKLLKSK